MPTPKWPTGWGVQWNHEPSDTSHSDPGGSPAPRGAGVSLRVIALDPGDRRTGIAEATVSPGKLTKVRTHVMPLKKVALWLAEQQGISRKRIPETGWLASSLSVKPTFDVIVYETFRPRPLETGGNMEWIRGNALLTPQLIGMIRLIGMLSGTELRAQGPLVKKPAFAQIASGMPGSAILKRRIASSNEQHDKDAIAHLWRYYCEHWR